MTARVLQFDDVGHSGAYPDWVRALHGASGCYIIRDKGTGQIVYVGMSHNNVYRTATRHFQQWSDEYNTAGATFERGGIELAAVLVPASHAPALELDLTCKLEPLYARRQCVEMLEHGIDRPADYDHDIEAVLDALFVGAELLDIEDVPF